MNHATTVTIKRLKKEMKYEGTTLLTYDIEYPELSGQYYQLSLLAINKIYKTKALAYQNYCETELFNTALQQYKDDIQNGYPVRVFEAMVRFTVTYNTACILSLYYDQYEFTGGAHGNTVRYSDSWNLQKAAKLQLCKLVFCPPNCKEYILKNVKRQIEKNPDIYFEDYAKLIDQYFNVNNFYCTPQGIMFYYQLYEIAPYSSGIREFFIIYNDCVINPKNLCFSVS